MALSLGHTNLLVLNLILSISKGLKHSTLEHPLQVLDLGLSEAKIHALCVNLIFKLILALESLSFMLFALGALLLDG
jgi:hypothetical protein